VKACSTVHAPSTASHIGGWQARLELEFGLSGSRTVLVHRSHSGPLLVLRPLYPEAEGEPPEPCHVYVIHPPGGVVSGDDLRLRVGVQAGAHALLTTPAAGKYYRRGGGGVARTAQEFHVGAAALEWLPQENIFYPDADVELSTVVHLAAAARFIGWEISCLGLPASQLTLADGQVRQSLELWHAGAPVLLERLLFDRSCLAARWGLANYAALGTWLAFPATAADLERARGCAADCVGLQLACTLVDSALVCRAWAQRADEVRGAFVELWRALRPVLLGRAAVSPRIWAT
jgi:urease accessory protein